MRVSIIAYKSDFNEFLRKNAGKFLFFGIIILISLVIAVKNGLQLEDFCGYFEKKNRIELQLIRGEKTIFSYLFAGLIEAIIIFALILACSYNDFTALFCPLVLIYKAYVDVLIDVIIIRFLGFSAIIYLIFRLLALIYN